MHQHGNVKYISSALQNYQKENIKDVLILSTTTENNFATMPHERTTTQWLQVSLLFWKNRNPGGTPVANSPSPQVTPLWTPAAHDAAHDGFSVAVDTEVFLKAFVSWAPYLAHGHKAVDHALPCTAGPPGSAWMKAAPAATASLAWWAPRPSWRWQLPHCWPAGPLWRTWGRAAPQPCGAAMVPTSTPYPRQPEAPGPCVNVAPGQVATPSGGCAASPCH